MDDLDRALAAVANAHEATPGSREAQIQATLLLAREVRRVGEKLDAIREELRAQATSTPAAIEARPANGKARARKE